MKESQKRNQCHVGSRPPKHQKPIWASTKMRHDHSFQHYCDIETVDLKTPVRRDEFSLPKCTRHRGQA